ncbi:MAG TPA: AAA family ATPase, partial [Ktedonobacterales bacterium]|nr:AAA family ATPase [Ktedonobacterales bacterium]
MTWQDGGPGGNPDVSGWRRPRAVFAYSDDGEPRPLRWLWPGQIPYGALTLFDGEEGWSDSPTLDLIARLTNGLDVAVAGDRETRFVWLLTPEDGPATEVEPVLDAAGVDTDQVQTAYGIAVWSDESEEYIISRFKLPDDVETLKQDMRSADFGMLIIDRLADYLNEYLSPTDYRDVRSALTPLAKVARDLNIVVLLLGCADNLFPGLPRDGNTAVPHPRSVARVKWLGKPPMSEYERLLAAARPSWYERERLDVWLRNELAAGPVPVKELEWLAEREGGWTPKQLRAAKKRLRVLAHRQGFGTDGYSLWALP